MANLAQARLRACLLWPYATSAVFRLVPIESDECPTLTMAVDPLWRLYVNPAWLETQTVEQAAVLILHEVGHLLRRHHKRARPIGVTNWERWNKATDAEINGSYQAEGLPIQADRITPASLGLEPGHLAETYYRQLTEKEEPEPEEEEEEEEQGDENGSGDDSGDAGDENGKESGDASGDAGNGSGDDSGDKASGDGQGVPTTGSSAADGIPRPWDQPAPEDGGPEAVNDAGAKQIARQIAKKIEENSKTQGGGAGGWRRWADEIVKPRVDWRRELRAIARRSATVASGGNDWTYRKPGRRMRENMLTPARVSPRLSVVAVLDTSGSVNDSDLALAVAEVEKLAKTIAAPESFRVIAADDAAGSVQRFKSRKSIDLDGGGGTDMRKPMAQAAALKPRPDVCLVITDGWTPWPASPIAVESIAVILPGGCVDLVPKWMKRVVMN